MVPDGRASEECAAGVAAGAAEMKVPGRGVADPDSIGSVDPDPIRNPDPDPGGQK